MYPYSSKRVLIIEYSDFKETLPVFQDPHVHQVELVCLVHCSMPLAFHHNHVYLDSHHLQEHQEHQDSHPYQVHLEDHMVLLSLACPIKSFLFTPKLNYN